MPFLNESEHFSFAHYSVVEIQSGKFNLLGVVDLQILAKPIIQRAVMFKFQCAKRMSDPPRVNPTVRVQNHRMDRFSIGLRLPDAPDEESDK